MLFKVHFRNENVAVQPCGWKNNYEDITEQIQTIFKIQEPFEIRYEDADYDAVLVQNDQDLKTLLQYDARPEGVRKLIVNIKGEQAPFGSISEKCRKHFGAGYADREIFEILYDLSNYVWSTEKSNPGFLCWVSGEKNLIKPGATPNEWLYSNGSALNRPPRVMCEPIEVFGSMDKRVSLWSNKQVTDWLNFVGLDECIEAFERHNIDGGILLHLTYESLKDVGIESLATRVKLANLLTQLYRNCHPVINNQIQNGYLKN